MKLIYIALVLLLLSAAGQIMAQTATLRGQVTDESGAIIPGATVKINGPSGFVKTLTTGSDGSYSFAGLMPGNYSVLATAPDLAMAQPAKVTLGGGVQTLNLQLKIASTVQQVTVQDNAGPGVTTEAANNASALVISGDDLQALSDDPEDLQQDLQALAGPSAGPNGGFIFFFLFYRSELAPPKYTSTKCTHPKPL